jgi:hypothetical protein
MPVSLQHSPGTQQQSELPVKAILPYLSFTFCLMYCSSSCTGTYVYKRNYLSCQQKLSKVSVEVSITYANFVSFVDYLAGRKSGFYFLSLATPYQ